MRKRAKSIIVVINKGKEFLKKKTEAMNYITERTLKGTFNIFISFLDY